MICFAEKGLMDFISWINAHYPAPKPVYITILHGYEMIKTEEASDTFALAAYKPGEKSMMYVPGNALPYAEDSGILYGSIAYDYKHHLQFCNNEPFDEEAAKNFADEIVRLWFSEKEADNESDTMV